MKIIWYVLVALLSVAALAHAQDSHQGGDDQLARIQKAYQGIRDLKGSFVQKNHNRDLKRTDVYKGQFLIKPPKMKWDYAGDKAQTIVINADTIFIYQKKLNQVIKSSFDRDTYGQAPIALLAGFGDIAQEFDVLSSAPDRLVLKPRKPMGNVTQIQVLPSDGDFPISGLVIIDSFGNRVDIALEKVQINTGIKSQVFDFRVPMGATVLDSGR